MKHLAYATIANDDRSIQVSTWKEPRDQADPLGPEDWHYKFTVNREVIDSGIVGPVEEDE